MFTVIIRQYNVREVRHRQQHPKISGTDGHWVAGVRNVPHKFRHLNTWPPWCCCLGKLKYCS